MWSYSLGRPGSAGIRGVTATKAQARVPSPDKAHYRYTVGSLFTGIAGLDLGLERAGFEVIWQSEIDPYACRVLAKHYPHVPNLGDITQIDWSHVRRPDLVCGGYPCQPFSFAGSRNGTDDPRHLWPHMARCLRLLRPRWALLENVPGHLSLGFDTVIADLAALGYDMEWESIPAAAVGAPHLRWRIFVVAHAEYSGQLAGGTDDQRGSGRTATVPRGSGQFPAITIRLAGEGRKALADAAGGRFEDQRQPWRDGAEVSRAGGDGEPAHVADAECRGSHCDADNPRPRQPDASGRRRGTEPAGRRSAWTVADAQRLVGASSELRGVFADAAPPGRQHRTDRCGGGDGDHWAVEPDVGRVANGIPNRVDRLRCLGNAVVPQVAEYVGRCILEAAS